jgi:CheY-like chemotaxis protein
MAEDIERIKSSAFSDYIAKPIKTAALIEKVQRLINQQKTA